jgi:hypothetical protein
MRKYHVGDEVVIWTDPGSYNYGRKFKITNAYFQMVDPSNPKLDKFSYTIQDGITILHRDEKDLYWIPSNTIDRPKGK